MGPAILSVSSGLTIPCWSSATWALPTVLSTPAASATSMWRSLTSAPWTGSCWAPRHPPARKPSGSVALPSRLPSSLPGTTSGSSSIQMPPALARPRASVSHTSEVTLAAGAVGHRVSSQGPSSTRHWPTPFSLPQQPRQWWDQDCSCRCLRLPWSPLRSPTPIHRLGWSGGTP